MPPLSAKVKAAALSRADRVLSAANRLAALQRFLHAWREPCWQGRKALRKSWNVSTYSFSSFFRRTQLAKQAKAVLEAWSAAASFPTLLAGRMAELLRRRKVVKLAFELWRPVAARPPDLLPGLPPGLAMPSGLVRFQ